MPAKETIHIFCDEEIENKLLCHGIIGFVHEEECRLVSFQNHIYKYNVEFHSEHSFNEEMNYIISFVNIYDESEIEESIEKIKVHNCINSETKIYIVAMTTLGKISIEEEEKRIQFLNDKFSGVITIIEKVYIPEKDDINEMFIDTMDKLFTHLTKGLEHKVAEDKGGCCRI